MDAKQLKHSILQYAMQGKLVPQDPNDEPASELLKRIKVEKEELIKQEVIKREKDLPEITEEEIPFEIPDSWKWERIGNVTIPIMGQSPKGDLVSEIYTEGSIEFHQGKSYFGNDTLDKSNKYVTKPTKLVESKAVLMSVRAPVGDVNIVDRKICVGRGLAALIPHNGIELEYLYFILKIMKPVFERQSTGSTFKAISASVIKEQLVPIPPIKEQERIIKQLTLLMKKQEIYSGLYEKTLQLQNTFPSKLEKSILQYAMQGKLVPQDPNDESASELLKRIKVEKEELIKQKVIKKEKDLPEITDSEVPFEIPESWEWVRLGEVAGITSGATPLKSNSSYYVDGKIPWCTSTVTGLEYVNEPSAYITDLALKECSLKVYPKGTLLMAMYGQGKTRGQVTELGFDSAINQACAAIELYNDTLTITGYIKLALKLVYNTIRQKAAGGAQPNLNQGKVKEILIPLPPIHEQVKIVVKYTKYEEQVRLLLSK